MNIIRKCLRMFGTMFETNLYKNNRINMKKILSIWIERVKNILYPFNHNESFNLMLIN